MPLSDPHSLSGKVYEKDGTTAVVGATVTAFDVTKQKWIEPTKIATTNAAGEYTLDAADINGGYDNGDEIQIVVIGTRVTGDERHTIDTDVGSHEKDIIIRHGVAHCGGVHAKCIVVSNSTESTKPMYVDLYNRSETSRILRIWCEAGQTEVVSIPDRGMWFKGGICVEYEDDTAGRIDCKIVTDTVEE